LHGGAWVIESQAGGFCWFVNLGVFTCGRAGGGRLVYVPDYLPVHIPKERPASRFSRIFKHVFTLSL